MIEGWGLFYFIPYNIDLKTVLQIFDIGFTFFTIKI